MRCNSFRCVNTICCDWYWVVHNLIKPIIWVTNLLNNKFPLFFLLFDLLYLFLELVCSFSLLSLPFSFWLIPIWWHFLLQLMQDILMFFFTLFPSSLTLSLVVPELELFLNLLILKLVLTLQLISLNLECFYVVSHLTQLNKSFLL